MEISSLPKTVGEGEENELEVGRRRRGPLQSNGKRYYLGSNALSFRREGDIEIQSPFNNEGLIQDFDLMEKIWDHCLRGSLGVETKEHPILLAESTFNTKAIREQTAEIMFEKFETPALFIAKDAVLTCFANGKSSGLVLDSGGSSTRATPVHDGYVLHKAMIKTRVGGEFLTEHYAKSLESKQVAIRPHYLIQSKKEIRIGEFEVILKDLPHVHESYKQFEARQIIRDVKESIFRVSDFAFDPEANANIPAISYELPDGNTIEVGTDRFYFPELLFNPSLLNKNSEILPESECLPIQNMIADSIAKCDQDIRKELFSTIITTGGNTIFPQFADRLFKELAEKTPQMYKCKIYASTPSDRKNGVWTGGSILASLGPFQQMWIGKQEFEEHGKSIVDRKCP
eukprot:TRINITY_DN4008_c0_g2_i1.p1 TRINITY_DN4008_c0_g2~~TRINITY_DN4008_c0_g2_i1.p1  ORF type:complete len:400 (+),score=127.36 TRINITY_DN4008_c0_g2_i1:471-1670(+)